MMKRIVSWLFFTMLALVAAAIVLPGFINWNKHKDLILAQVEPYFSRKISVGGNLSFSILPNPQILLEDVTIENVKGGASSYFIKLKVLEAQVALKPLLEGKVIVEHINLVEPDIHLEILADGMMNWSGVLAQTPPKPKGSGVELERVSMKHGQIHYTNNATGAAGKIEQLNLTVSAPSLAGPYSARGDMLFKDFPVNVEIESGLSDGKKPVPLRFSFLPIEALPQIIFNGEIQPAAGFDIHGDIELTQGKIASILPSAFFADVPFLHDIADVKAVLDISGGAIKFSQINADFGKGSGLKGDVSVELRRGEKPAVIARMEGHDLALANKPGLMPAPDAFDGRFDLRGKNISWNGLSFPSVALAAETARGEWVISNANITLGGETVFRFSGLVSPAAQTSSLTLGLSSQDLAAAIPSLPFKMIELSGNLDVTPEKISLYNFDAKSGEKDSFKGVLNIQRQAPVFSADAEIAGTTSFAQNFNLTANLTGQRMTGSLTADAIDFDIWRTPADISLAIKAKKAFWRGNEVADAEMMFEKENGALKVSGIKGRLWGGILDAAVNGDTLTGKVLDADLDGLRKLAELEGFSLGKGVVEINLKDSGNTEKMFGAISGDVVIRSDSLKISSFNPAELPQMLKGFAAMPENLSDAVVKSLSGQGESLYKNAVIPLKFADGKVTFDAVTLRSDNHETTIKGEYDLSPKTYKVSGGMNMTGVPVFTFEKSADGLKVDATSLETFVRDNLPPPPQPEPAVIHETPSDPIGGILDRLDQEDTIDVAPVPEAQPLEEDILPPEDEAVMDQPPL